MKVKFWKLLQNQLGFTLPEIMIGGAILAGVGLAGATLFKNQTDSQARIEHDLMLSQFHTSLSKILENDHNCNATMKVNGNKYGSASLGTSDDITGVYLCDTTTTTCNANFNAQTVVAVTGAVFLREGDWIDKSSSRQIWRMTKVDYPIAVTKSGPLRIRFEYTLNPNIGTRTVTKEAIVNVRFNEDAVSGPVGFIECFNDQESSVNNLQNDVCKSFYPALTNVASDGGLVYWDESSQSCKLNGTPGAPLKDCTAFGLMVEGIRSDGTAHCRSIGQGFDSTPLVDSTSCPATSSVQLVWSGSQLKVTCVP